MSIEDLTKISNLIIVVISGGILTLLTTVFGMIYQTKMYRKNLEKADNENQKSSLDNSQTEISLADAINKLAMNSASKAIDFYKVTQELQNSYNQLKLEASKEKVEREQERILYEKEQEKMKSEIAHLKSQLVLVNTQLNNQRLYTNALVAQMKEKLIEPIKIEDVPGVVKGTL